MSSHEQSSRAEALLESGGEEEADYESDSEEGTSALALRRRVASDDEEDDQEMNAERRPAYYDDDVEDQGVPLAEDDEEEEEEYEDAEEAAGLATRRRDMNEEEEEDDGGEELAKHQHEDMEDVTEKPAGSAGNAEGSSKEGAEGEKKDAEPFVVPTAGAFYMHDDRFRYNGVARPRRSAGGRKLWEAKDEKPWVHDRFEELKLNEEMYYGQGVRGRRGRGRQGRGQGRGKDLGHARGRGSRERVVEDALHLSRRGPGRGRGLRRAKMDDYEFKESHSAGNRGLASSSRESSNSSLMPKPAPLQPTTKPPEAGSTKPTTSSILNSASPPFFPTGTISHNLKGVLAGTSKGAEEKLFGKAAPQVGRLVSTSRTGMEKGMTGVSAASMTRPSSSPGNITRLAHVSNTVEVNTGLHRSLARGPNTSQQQLLKIGSGSMLQQQRPVRADGNTQHMVELPLLSAASQQTVRGTTPAQPLRVQQPHQQLQTTSQGQISKGQPLQSQSVVSPVSLSAKSAVDLKAAPSSPGNKLGSGASGRGTQATTVQTGRGSFVYGGSSLTNGLRSVVQFAGQSQSGLGVPAVGVALPGYSSQPQFGFPDSEVTWIPILAGGGSLSSNYSSPYIAVDGGSPAVYYTQQASQPSSFPVPGREMNGSKTATSSSFKPPARPEPDEFGQQRRRYSQMTFGEERR